MDNQETTPDAPTHTPGTNKGEETSEKQGKEPGRDEGEGRTARDSTGVSVEHGKPIDPNMPDMPPA